MTDRHDCGLLTKESAAIPLRGVEVTGTLIGRSARVKVRQHFRNSGSKPVEAIYKFPLPESSSICGFRVAAGDRLWEGQIEERAEAFKQYDEALARGDGGYLLDEDRPNIFTLSVGNLGPNASAVVEVEYTIMLDAHGQDVRFFLPTTISPRYVPDGMDDEDIPVKDIVSPVYADSVPYGLKISLDVHGSAGISSIDSPSHSIRTSFGDDLIKVEFSAEAVAMDRDFLLDVTYKDEVRNRAFVYRGGEASYIQLDFSPALQAGGKHDQDAEIIFVLDCSGSMGGSSIAEAKQALAILLKGLGGSMRFNIYRFGSTFENLFPISKPYTDDNLNKAISYLSGVTADLGGTELLAPLRDIYGAATEAGKNRKVVVITDGEIGNEQEVASLVRDNAGATVLFAIGIGHGPNEYLIKQLARSSGGAAECIAPGDRIEPRVLRLFKKVTSSRIGEFTVEWGCEVEQAPLSPAVYEGEAISLFGKTHSDPGTLNEIVVSGEYMGSRQEWRVEAQPVAGAHMPVPLLWARERIRDLEEGTAATSGSKQLHRKDAHIKDAIVTLSREHGVLSRATSFIAVEKRRKSERTTGDMVLRKIPVMLTKDWHGDVSYLRRPTFMSRTDVLLDSVAGPDHAARTYRRGQLPSVAPSFTPRETVRDRHHDHLFSILAAQRARGGFELNEDLAQVIGLSYKDLRVCAQKITGQGRFDRWLLLSTIIVLRILEERFSSMRAVWYDVTQKSQDWYYAEQSRVKPALEGEDLPEWAIDYIRKNKV